MVALAIAIFLFVGSLVIAFAGRDKRGYCDLCGRFILPRGKYVLRTNRCPECDAVVIRDDAVQ
jgi:hypothetical protein